MVNVRKGFAIFVSMSYTTVTNDERTQTVFLKGYVDMNILITSDWYAPVTNGVVTSVQNLRQGLIDLGHDVRILTLSDTLRTQSIRDGVYYLHSLNASFVYPDARCGLPAGHAFRKTIRDWQPDIIHSQTEFSTFVIARQLARQQGIPHVHTYHTIYENYTHYFSPNHRIGKWGIARFCRNRLNRTNAVIVPSEKTAEHLQAYRLRPPVYVIPSGTDIRRFSTPIAPEQLLALRQSLHIPDNAFVLLHVGRIGKEKNIEEILRCMSKVPQQNVYLVLVGDGPYVDQIRKAVNYYHLQDRIRFTGMVPHDHIVHYYQMADLFVNASTSETQGLTFGEALASGLPVLCYRDPCLADVVINGYNGCQCASPEEFIQELLHLIKDRPCLMRYAKQAKRFMYENYSREIFAKRVDAVYRACLTGH